MTAWQERLAGIFRSKVNITDEEVAALLMVWKHKRLLKRNDFLIRQGETETNLFYVIEGSMRIYYPHQDEEICVGFAHDHNLICSFPSFIRQLPSDYFIQALAKTDVISIHRNDFYGVMENHRSIEKAWRMLEEDALLGKIERETEMLTFTPEERYRRLMERSPHVFRNIPRKYIASYLRMTPETLSRVSASP
jgi:CRP-like cAMP-binding protein